MSGLDDISGTGNGRPAAGHEVGSGSQCFGSAIIARSILMTVYSGLAFVTREYRSGRGQPCLRHLQASSPQAHAREGPASAGSGRFLRAALGSIMQAELERAYRRIWVTSLGSGGGLRAGQKCPQHLDPPSVNLPTRSNFGSDWLWPSIRLATFLGASEHSFEDHGERVLFVDQGHALSRSHRTVRVRTRRQKSAFTNWWSARSVSDSCRQGSRLE